MSPTLSDASPQVPIDVTRLIETRMLIQANSGAGKSWAIRRLLEQTHGSCQQIVLDVEGEFHTLREKYDYILAAPKGGDCPADVKSAALLARKLLELGVSAIIDIYELGRDRDRFVKLFLENLISAPKDLWHPAIIVVDEAALFCPEGGRAESAGAVIDLMTRGRKRGFCGVLATQRISKLNKDAAAEANNKLIGRSSLDIDMKRAAAELGFTDKEQIRSLRSMPPGFFYAFGPALTSGVVAEVKIGPVRTTHPKAGARGLPPTPPRERVRQVLSQLADLPHEAEEEAKTVGELRARVADLTKQLKSTGNAERPDLLEMIGSYRETDKQLRAKLTSANLARQVMTETIGRTILALQHVVESATTLDTKQPVGVSSAELETYRGFARSKQAQVDAQFARADRRRRETLPPPRKLVPVVDGDGLSRMERAMLTSLAQHPYGLSKRQLCVYTGYSAGGAVSACFAKITREGWVCPVPAEGTMVITDPGLAALGAFEPLPTGDALRAHVLSNGKLSAMEKKIFAAVCDAWPDRLEKRRVLEITGYSAGGATSAAFAHLVALDYLESDGRGALIAAKEMFD